ncbi:hypothetical protein [Demequina muriae]|uniref:Leucine rich repeat variant n=1 Tax=Demequina muriae TaxID=3051664 RepID=A0ABT8GF93_9MICO|nr:hypothetical protein [Demequina sp. EGI L300058]MDN4480024.1 hypothetical protein [Demequina sp. EGI L300058]
MFSENYSRQTALASVEKALDPNLTDAELATLARSEEAKVRAAVAQRPATPLTTLLKLASDESPTVRVGVARNQRPNIPEDLHDQLAHDKVADVVYALIENPTVPDAVIGRLARQFHKEYASAARARLASKGGAAKVLGRLGIATAS